MLACLVHSRTTLLALNQSTGGRSELFFSRIYSLSKNTPHNVIVQEFNLQHVGPHVLEQALTFISISYTFDDDKSVKISLDRLNFLVSVPGNIIKCNWFSQIKWLFRHWNHRLTFRITQKDRQNRYNSSVLF